MTPVIKAVLALAALCLTVAVGVSSAHNSRALRHYYRFLYAGRNEMYDEALEEYKYLPAKFCSLRWRKQMSWRWLSLPLV